jgi:hypothetical protein
LAQRVEDRRCELRQFIHEQDPVMGQGHLAEARPAASATDESGSRCGVVGSPERPVPNEATADCLPCGGMDLGDLQRFFGFERREDRGEAAGQQCFSGAGSPDHEQVMAAGCRDLESAAGSCQASHDGQVGPRVFLWPVAVGRLRRHRMHWSPVGLALEGITGLRQRPRRKNPDPINQRCLSGVVRRNQRCSGTGAAQRVDHDQDTGNRSQRPIEAQLADNAHPIEHRGGQLLRRRHQAECEGQIEPRP